MTMHHHSHICCRRDNTASASRFSGSMNKRRSRSGHATRGKLYVERCGNCEAVPGVAYRPATNASQGNLACPASARRTCHLSFEPTGCLQAGALCASSRGARCAAGASEGGQGCRAHHAQRGWPQLASWLHLLPQGGQRHCRSFHVTTISPQACAPACTSYKSSRLKMSQQAVHSIPLSQCSITGPGAPVRSEGAAYLILNHGKHLPAPSCPL